MTSQVKEFKMTMCGQVSKLMQFLSIKAIQNHRFVNFQCASTCNPLTLRCESAKLTTAANAQQEVMTPHQVNNCFILLFSQLSNH